VQPKPELASAWVYILRCADGSLYTGWTVDVDRRLAAHAAGTASRYTRARREEARIKQLRRPAKLALAAGAGA